jgi:hypothetical protein
MVAQPSGTVLEHDDRVEPRAVAGRRAVVAEILDGFTAVVVARLPEAPGACANEEALRESAELSLQAARQFVD